MNVYPETDTHRQEADEFAKPRELVVPKKVVFAALGVVLFVFLLFSGLLNRGYESKTIRFSNFSRVTEGSSFGSKRFFLREGQIFTADYEAQIESGSLYIRLRDYWAPLKTPTTGEVRLRESGSGRLRVEIPATGVYQLRIDGLPDRDGYHLSYTVSWKAE